MIAIDRRHVTTVHEAGHALASILLGVGTKAVEVYRDGGMHYRADVALCPVHDAVIDAAGWAAVTLLTPGPPTGCDVDDQHIRDLFGGSERAVDVARRRAVKLLRPYLRQLLLLAQVLYVRGTMSGAEVLSVLGLRPRM